MVFGLIFRPIPVAIVPIFHNLFILVKENINDGRIGSDLVAQFLGSSSLLVNTFILSSHFFDHTFFIEVSC